MADRQWFVYHITESVLQNYRSARIIRQRSRPLDNRRVPCILYEASILAMPLLIELTIIVAAAALLCIYVGWGVARLALPPSLMPFRAPLTPLVGYATVLWTGFMLASLALNLRWTLVVLLAGATMLNVLAWRAEGRPRPLTWLRAQPEALIPPLLALLTGILPLLSYGYLTIIGRGWDTESYLPMAQHLIDYPLPRIMDAPPGLLRDLVAHPPRIGLTLGFSVFHGMTMLLSMSSALASFAPVIAFLRALSALAVYVWLRTTMGLGRTGSFFGALLTTLASLPLWIGYFNFGMQMSAWCLLPLALTVGLAAVDHLAQRRTAAWRAALLAAIILASIPVAYYPALVIAVPLIAATGAARLLEIWRHPQRQITPVALTLAALALAVPTFAAATLAILDYFEGFSFRYSLIEPKIGPDRFIGLEEIIGLTAFRLTTDDAQPPALLVGAAALAAMLLCVAGLAIDIAPCGRSAGRPPSWTLPCPLKGWRLTSRRAGVLLKGWRLEIAPLAGVPPSVHLRGRCPVRWGAGDWTSRRAGVLLGEGLAIGHRAVGTCRRASAFADAAPSAKGWRLEIAPWGRAAGRPPSRTHALSAGGLAIDIAPWGRAAEGLAIEIAPCGRAAGRPPSADACPVR
jgi:hypothetical protein